MKDYKETVRFWESNILNLGYAHYEGTGKWDIPVIKRQKIENLELYKVIDFNKAVPYAKDRKKCPYVGVHFFLHDYHFERVWNKPLRYINMFKKYGFILSPDFSPYADMPLVTQIFNVYRNRWIGRFYQEQGIKVIPTVTFNTDDKSLEYCLDGIEKHSTIAISTMGEGRWGKYEKLKQNWDYILDTLQPETILLYGKKLDLKGNIIHIPYTGMSNQIKKEWEQWQKEQSEENTAEKGKKVTT